MFCLQCGTKLPENARFCDECGFKQRERPAHSTTTKKSAAEEARAWLTHALSTQEKAFEANLETGDKVGTLEDDAEKVIVSQALARLYEECAKHPTGPQGPSAPESAQQAERFLKEYFLSESNVAHSEALLYRQGVVIEEAQRNLDGIDPILREAAREEAYEAWEREHERSEAIYQQVMSAYEKTGALRQRLEDELAKLEQEIWTMSDHPRARKVMKARKVR